MGGAFRVHYAGKRASKMSWWVSAGIFLRVLTADIPNPFLKTRPGAEAGRRSATDFAAPGCAMAHRPRCWRVGRQKRRRPTEDRPPCPEPSTPQSIKPAPMREERSSLVIRNRPCLQWGACRRNACAEMPEPCCLPVKIAPNGGLGLS